MFFRDAVFLVFLVKSINSCIPTQQVEIARAAAASQAVAAAIKAEEAREAQVALEVQQAEAIAIYEAIHHTTTTTLAPGETTTTTVADTTTTTDTVTTTTTTTTTTTVITTTTTVYPCSTCAPIYYSGCQGYNMPSPSSYCLTADEVPITYMLGPVASPSLPADTCYTYLACPSGTVARVNYGGSYIMGNSDGSPTLTYCSESNGIWYSDVNSFMIMVMDIACQYP